MSGPIPGFVIGRAASSSSRAESRAALIGEALAREVEALRDVGRERLARVRIEARERLAAVVLRLEEYA